MVWLGFAFSAIIVVAAGILIAQASDAIAFHTGLGSVFFGTLLLGLATSLPELITGFEAIALGLPDLAAGNLLGSIMNSIFILGLLDLVVLGPRLLHRIAVTHSLTAALGALLTSGITLFMLVPLGLQWGNLDLESIILLLVFLVGARLVQFSARQTSVQEAPARLSLGWALLGFAASAVLLLLVTPLLVSSAESIAELTGIGTGFIGLALFPLITNMPDLATSVAAIRLGNYDLAVGNAFGSCVFKSATLALVSLFYGPSSLFTAISPGFEVVGLLSVILINLALLSTLHPERRVRRIPFEWDAAVIILVYLAGLFLIYQQGLLLIRR